MENIANVQEVLNSKGRLAAAGQINTGVLKHFVEYLIFVGL